MRRRRGLSVLVARQVIQLRKQVRDHDETETEDDALQTRAVEQHLVRVFASRSAVGRRMAGETAACLASSLGVDLARRSVGDLLAAREAELAAALRTRLAHERLDVGEIRREGGLFVRKIRTYDQRMSVSDKGETYTYQKRELIE